MTSKVVKCNNCNIVISEVLAFIQNKIDVMSEESIVKICTSSFSAEEIEQAKNLLFDSLTTTKRKITRKRDGRKQRDLFDVISVFKETDPNETPIFVARVLQKLPPILWDHLDATRILKDILVLQNELKTLKETCVSVDKFEEVKNDLNNLKQTSIVNNYDCYVSKKRGGGGVLSNSYFMDSGPTGLPHILERSQTAEITSPGDNRSVFSNKASGEQRYNCDDELYRPITNTSVGRDVGCVDIQSKTPTSPVLPQNIIQIQDAKEINRSHSTHPPASTPAQPLKNFASTVSAEGQWKTEKPDEGWILAQRKKHKNRFATVEGNAIVNPNDKFRAAEIRVPLFINNVDSTTTENDIVDYLFTKTQTKVTLQKINSRVQKKYNAYKMMVPHSKLALFLEGSLWPMGVTFRRFIDFKKPTLNGSHNGKK